MRILMIAPEPYFEPRGTPFSEYHRIRALTTLGHTVDLVTYPFGTDVEIPGLRIFRSMRPPFVSRVKIGPSLAKLPLDAFLTLAAFRRALSGNYDVIHSHEEGGLIGIVLATAASLGLSVLMGVPYIFNPGVNLLSFVFSAGIGVVFGYFPARRAARMDPIDALRHE